MRPHLFAAALLLAATPAFAQVSESTTTRTSTAHDTDCTSLATATERQACVASRGASGSSSEVTTGDERSSAEVKQRTTTHKEGLFGSETDSKTKSSATVIGPDGTAQKETTTDTHTER
jgi:hypothetical protein